MKKETRRQLIWAAVLVVLAGGILARWQVYQVMTAVPEKEPAKLEQAIDRCMERYPQWELDMEARYLASKQIGDRLYVAFTNEADGGSLCGAIFVRHPYWGWELSRMDTGAALPLASFEDFDAGRTIVIGTGEDCAPVARWVLCSMEDWMPVYGEAPQTVPFVHVEEGLLCTLAYDAAGNEQTELFDALQTHHGYTVKTHTRWTWEVRNKTGGDR